MSERDMVSITQTSVCEHEARQHIMQDPVLSAVPLHKLEKAVDYSPNPISPSETNQLRHRNPLRDKWKYTSGRFLYNEIQRLAERRTHFDLQALEREVSKCMNHAKVLSTRVYLEGGSSRLLQMNLDDRRKVIVKISYQSQPPHYATASEVATLSFLRTKGIPVPKVYGWSSNVSRNKAGVEFIIMEKARGVAANICLNEMEKSDVEQMVAGLIGVEKFLFGLPFSAFGSLYFKHDIPQEHQRPLFDGPSTSSLQTDERYCIGPATDPFFWPDKTTKPNKHHGPWQTTSEYLQSVGHCALQWLNRYGTSTRNKFPYNSLFEEKTSVLEQEHLIKKYMSIASLLLAETTDVTLHKPVLRHPGLRNHNIFMSRSIVAVSCITNWRHATILPFAIAAGFPLAFDSPSSPQGSFRSPRLPPNFHTTMDRTTQADAKRVYLNQLLHYTYRIKTALHNKTHAGIIDILPVQVLQRLQHILRSPWTGVKDVVLLKGALIAVGQNWRNFSTGIACPTSLIFDADELEDQAHDEELLDDAEELITYIKKEIGIYYDDNDATEGYLHSGNDQGWVSHEKYEAARQRNRQLKEEWMAQAENIMEERQIDFGWMFQDDEDEVNDGASAAGGGNSVQSRSGVA